MAMLNIRKEVAVFRVRMSLNGTIER